MDISSQQTPPSAAESGVRLLGLGAVYAVAAFVAVAFSPAMGFVTAHHPEVSARLASVVSLPLGH